MFTILYTNSLIYLLSYLLIYNLFTVFYLLIYLFIGGSFNDCFKSSDNIAMNEVISEL